MAGTGDGKPGTHNGASGTTGYVKPSTRDGKPGTNDGVSGTTRYDKPGTGDGEPEPGTHDQGAPGAADGRVRDGTSAGNEMDRDPGTGDGKPGIRDGAMQCTCVYTRLLNTLTLVKAAGECFCCAMFCQ